MKGVDMKKSIIFCLFFCVVAAFVGFIFSAKGYAIPAAPLLHTLVQPDGLTINAKQWGDESCHGWETEDGFTIVFDRGLNSWAYATNDTDGGIISSSKIVGRDDIPDECVPHIRKTGLARSKIIRRMTTKEASAALFQAGNNKLGDENYQKVVSSSGTANIPVILINFKDTSTTYTTIDFNSLLFGTGNYSMKDYYEEVSYGKFSVSGGPSGVVGWYTASKGHDYYGENDSRGDDMWPGDLVYEAVVAADANVDFSAYDMDNDGYVDAVNVIHQGTDEAAGGGETDIWSHRWSLDSAKFSGNSHYGAYTTNDRNSKGNYIKVNDYTMEAEKHPDGHQETIGVFAHEYGHALGLPDLYDTDGSSVGIGDWSIMASGSYNNVSVYGDRPAHMDAGCKYYLKWVTPTQVTGTLTNETITEVSSTADVYKLVNKNLSSSEYFLVENRQKTGFDVGLPGSGLLIWHIDQQTVFRKISLNTVNNNECYPPNSCSSKHYGEALVPADNNWDLEKYNNYGDTGDPYPGSRNNTSFTSTSSPNSKLYDGRNSLISVTNISASRTDMTATLSVGN